MKCTRGGADGLGVARAGSNLRSVLKRFRLTPTSTSFWLLRLPSSELGLERGRFSQRVLIPVKSFETLRQDEKSDRAKPLSLKNLLFRLWNSGVVIPLYWSASINNLDPPNLNKLSSSFSERLSSSDAAVCSE